LDIYKFTADVIDGDSCASLKEDMGRVLKAGNFNAKESTRGVAMQKWMTNKLLETINLYGKEGRVLFQNCQRGWLDMWDTSTEKRATTFEDYISQRVRNYSLS
jgi:hypothetical protein